ncbi:hypothetical protein NDU88_005740 [Pleurodeles waltl]|uniref:Uncharacterized protein n=1 Tax=Pleurodeles waltl TaxID=8319 RepID=A0AAV7MBX0_PLEWA|nr:hypothetical protein NDU88_005740 [Pleurodeles waltl]
MHSQARPRASGYREPHLGRKDRKGPSDVFGDLCTPLQGVHYLLAPRIPVEEIGTAEHTKNAPRRPSWLATPPPVFDLIYNMN